MAIAGTGWDGVRGWAISVAVRWREDVSDPPRRDLPLPLMARPLWCLIPRGEPVLHRGLLGQFRFSCLAFHFTVCFFLSDLSTWFLGSTHG
jgi:hypothetical protein